MKRLHLLTTTASLCLAFSVAGAQDLQEIMGQITDATRPAVYEPEYDFDMYLQVKTSEQGGRQMSIEGYLSRDGNHVAILFPGMGESTVLVLDTRNRSVLVLSNAEGSKSGFAMSVNTDALAELGSGIQEELPRQSFDELRTGNRKDIAGFTCEEYVIRDEKGVTRIWTSEELGKELEKVMEANKALFGSAMVRVEGLRGMVMEYSYSDASGELDRNMTITKLDMNARYNISTGDYQIMSMGQQ